MPQPVPPAPVLITSADHTADSGNGIAKDSTKVFLELGTSKLAGLARTGYPCNQTRNRFSSPKLDPAIALQIRELARGASNPQ